MRDQTTPSVRLGREIQLNIVELPKADRLANSLAAMHHAPGSIYSAMAAWIAYFAHWKEETIMNQIAYPPVLEALQQLKALSADDEARRLAEVRERAILSENTEIEAALARGAALGEVKAKAEALQRLIASGIPEAQARTILQM